MLAYILALMVSTGSLYILVKAVLAKELQRQGNLLQTDIFWGGVGLFYALVLWICAGRITGAILLAQLASVSLIGWFGWQTLTLRSGLQQAQSQVSVSPTDGQQEDQTTTKEASKKLPFANIFSPITNLFGKSKPQTGITLNEVAEDVEPLVETETSPAEEVLEEIESQASTVVEEESPAPVEDMLSEEASVVEEETPAPVEDVLSEEVSVVEEETPAPVEDVLSEEVSVVEEEAPAAPVEDMLSEEASVVEEETPAPVEDVLSEEASVVEETPATPVEDVLSEEASVVEEPPVEMEEDGEGEESNIEVIETTVTEEIIETETTVETVPSQVAELETEAPAIDVEVEVTQTSFEPNISSEAVSAPEVQEVTEEEEKPGNSDE